LDLTEGEWRPCGRWLPDGFDGWQREETTQVASHGTWRAPGASSEFNATEYLSKQFNPFVAENIPPMILDFRVRNEQDWFGPILEHVWAHVDVELFDASDDNVAVISTRTLAGSYDDQEVVSWGAGFYSAQVVLSVDPLRSVVDGYWVNLTVFDKDGANKAWSDIEVPGLTDMIADFLSAIWNAMWAEFEKAWEAVKSAVNFIIDFVKGIVDKIINTIFAPLIAAFESWVNNIRSQFEAMQNNGGDTSYLSAFNAIFKSSFMDIITAIVIGIMTVIAVVGTITRVMAGATIVVTDYATDLAMQVFIASQKALSFAAITTLVTVGGAAIITAAISAFAPESGLGIELIDFGASLNSYIVTNKMLTKGWPVQSDTAGLWYSLTGLALTLAASFISHVSVDIALFVSAMALGVSVMGAYHCFKTRDGIDIVIGKPLGYLEEIIALIAAIYAGLEFVHYLAVINAR
jgi:hypothetical protein